MPEYLIAHRSNHQPRTASVGAVHQKTIGAKTEQDAKEQFEQLYPDREITLVALKED